MRLIDLTGQQFGRLTVLFRVYGDSDSTLWRCRCECGATINTASNNLQRGLTRSCGCLARELASMRAKTHGRSHTPEYESWLGARDRCHNPKDQAFQSYGGRGITMCPEWRNDFSAFFGYVGSKPSPAHSIDRIDNDRGYEPGNVRWATRREQNMNQRQHRGRNTFRDVNDNVIKIRDAAHLLAMPYAVLHRRILRAANL